MLEKNILFLCHLSGLPGDGTSLDPSQIWGIWETRERMELKDGGLFVIFK
jgi:hypothetical protein